MDVFDEATGLTTQQKVEEESDEQEELIEEISRKEFPNLCFIALTATPSDKTIQHFGREGRPFDVYSMDEAIGEGYIMDVAKASSPTKHFTNSITNCLTTTSNTSTQLCRFTEH